MSDIINRIRADAAQKCRTVVLPEATDERILRAALKVKSTGIARPILLGQPERIRASAAQFGLELGDVVLYDVDEGAQSKELVQYLKSRPRYSKYRPGALSTALHNPLIQACCLLATGQADACVAGAVNTTSQVIQQGIRIVGTTDECPLLSSFFLMVFDEPPAEGLDFALYADCGIVVDPDCRQLALISCATAGSAQHIFSLKPRIALLSFSTAGSARHRSIKKITCAREQLENYYPGLKVIGEVQFDAALLPSVRQHKLPEAAYPEPANVFIFPDLNSGNIAYKITERVGGARAIGPIFQGLKKPLNDVSRGADVEAIVNTIAVSCLQVRSSA